MNSRRLARVLQVVSYDVPEYGHSVPARELYKNRISIQEAIAMYMQTAVQFVTPPIEKPPNVSERSRGREEPQGRTAYPGYMVVMEANRIESQCRQNAREQQAFKNQRRKQGSVGAPQQRSAPEPEQIRYNDFDRLDVNRTEGFLLYSYDRHGIHSALGEGVRPGGYGDISMPGDYANKA